MRKLGTRSAGRTLSRPQPPGWLDIRPGTVLTAPSAWVTGWMVAEPGYGSVEVQLEPGPVRRARLFATPRPDAKFPEFPSAAIAGWQVLIDVPTVEHDTPLALRAVAVGTNGRCELGRVEVLVRAPSPEPMVSSDVAALAARANEVARRHRPSTGGLHLLVTTHGLGLAGGELYLRDLLRELLRTGDVACTVLSHRDGPLRSELESWGARVQLIAPIDASPYEPRMLELAALAATTTANVVFANTSFSFWAVDLAARCGIPAVWSIHESHTVDNPLADWIGTTAAPTHMEHRLAEALSSAAAVIFESDATRGQYVAHGSTERFVRLDYGIDLAEVEECRAAYDRSELRCRHGFDDDAVLLLCVGHFEPRKAQAALALAFGRVATQFPSAVLALVGDNVGAFAGGVREVVRRLGLQERVRLIPPTRAIRPWYLMADALVSASDTESLPRSMLEAMAFGTPVLGAAVAGVPELIEDGKTGMLFEPLCLDAMTEGLERFLRLSPDERRALGQRGRELVLRTRSSGPYAKTIRRLLDELVADPRALPTPLTDAARR